MTAAVIEWAAVLCLLALFVAFCLYLDHRDDRLRDRLAASDAAKREDRETEMAYDAAFEEIAARFHDETKGAA